MVQKKIIYKNHLGVVNFYYMLFCLSYIGIYYVLPLAIITNILLIILSYKLIIADKKFYPVLFLLIYSHCICGFIIPGNQITFKILIILTEFLPLFLYALLSGDTLYKLNINTIVNKYLFTTLYVGWMLYYCFFNFEASVLLFFPRVMPMLMFLISLALVKDYGEWSIIRNYFRYIFLFSLLVYAFSDYAGLTKDIIMSGMVFSVADDSIMLSINDIVRNMSVFWDPRIFGLFSVIFLLMVIVSKSYRLKIFDFILALTCLATSTSRGSIALGLIVLIGVIIKYRKPYHLLATIAIIAFILVLKDVIIGNASDDIKNYINTFNVLSSETNVLSQRGAFKDYALNWFYDHPMGSGVGYLKSGLIDHSVRVDTMVFSKVGDAFLFVQLAEIGFIGFFLFIASCFEIFYRRSIISLSFTLGILIVMYGTDLPDMGFYYLTFLILSNYILNKPQSFNATKIIPLPKEVTLQL